MMLRQDEPRQEVALPEATAAEPPCAEPASGVLPAAAVRVALDRVLAAEELNSSPQLSAFLRFVVDATLEGRSEAIKGYTIAVEALGRDPSFDPQADPIVRVEATRLRRALERYYAGAGASDEIEIVVQRGSYVPSFRRRNGMPAEPAGERAGIVPPPTDRPATLPAEPDTQMRRWRISARNAVFAVLLVGLGLAAGIGLGGPGWTALLGPSSHPVDRPNRLGIPMVEVRPFEAAGSLDSATEFDPRALEVRVRDALARFDLLDVLATPDARPVLDCGSAEARPHSAFALGGMVENHEDGTSAVLLRLTDLCDGTIAWSREFESLKRSADPGAAEVALVRDIVAAIAEPQGVIQSRARLRAAEAGGIESAGPYGCVLMAFNYWRSFAVDEHERARRCLESAVAADPSFAAGHALLAELYLDEVRNAANPRSEPPLDRALAAAEQAVELEPASAFAHRVLLDVHFFRGERAAAVAAGEAAIALNPYDIDAMADFGGRLIALGDVARGEALLEEAAGSSAGLPDWADYHRTIAAYLRGDGPAAEAAAGEIIGDGFAPGLLARVLAHHLAGATDAAHGEARRLAAAAPAWANNTTGMVARFFPDPAIAARVRADLLASGLGGGTAAH